MKKAQAAMEYLITYGWAIVVIVVVLGVLAGLSLQGNSFEYCKFNKNSFNCNQFVVYKIKKANGYVNYVDLKFIYNGYKTIKITDLACAKKGEDYNLRLLGNAELGNHIIYIRGDLGEIKGLSCGLNYGEDFEGVVVLRYTDANNGVAYNTAIASIKSKVSET